MRTSVIYQKFTLLYIAKNGHLTCLLGPTVFERKLCPIHGEMNSLYRAKMTWDSYSSTVEFRNNNIFWINAKIQKFEKN